MLASINDGIIRLIQGPLLSGQDQMTKPPQHVGAVGHVDARGLQDRGGSGDRITPMNQVLAAEPGMVGIEQRQAGRVIELGIGHHLIDVGLRDALLGITQSKPVRFKRMAG